MKFWILLIVPLDCTSSSHSIPAYSKLLSLFPIGFPTAWFDWKSCVIRSCLFCWLYITICVLYCQLFCLKFLFFLFIFYLFLNCVCFIFKYIFLTESLKCKKHGKNPDNTVPSSLRFHWFPPLPAHMSCALLQLLTQQPRRDFEASTDSHCRCSAVLRYWGI